MFALIDSDGDGIIKDADVEAYCTRQEAGRACNASKVIRVLALSSDGSSEKAFAVAFGRNQGQLAEAGLDVGYNATAEDMGSRDLATQLNAVVDTCNDIKCALVCEDECGWSRPDAKCMRGIHTSASEIRDRLGDCPGDDDKGSANTAVGILVGVCIFFLVCLAAGYMRHKLLSESFEGTGLHFSNPTFNGTTGGPDGADPADGDLTVDDGDLYVDAAAAVTSAAYVPDSGRDQGDQRDQAIVNAMYVESQPTTPASNGNAYLVPVASAATYLELPSASSTGGISSDEDEDVDL